MKKVFLLFALMATGMCARAQVDTLRIGDREPTFYYWDTNWWDYYYLNYTSLDPEMKHLSFGINYSGPHSMGQIEIARLCHTDQPLRIIGVAAPIDIVLSSRPTVDTSMSGRLPEYFRLYEDLDTMGNSMVFKAESRWDTFSPRYAMALNKTAKWVFDTITHIGQYIYWSKYAPVYEGYFDSAIIVDGDFYVSGTRNNNYYIDGYTCAHIETRYFATMPPVGADIDRFQPYSIGFKYRAHLQNEVNPCDTNIWQYCVNQPWGEWLNIFPIIDTSRNEIVVVDTCNVPTEFRLIDVDNNCATFGWNNSGTNIWELSIVNLSANNPDTTLTTHMVTFASVSNLQNQCTYEARVRSVCNDGEVSDWSDSIVFHLDETGAIIIGDDTTGGGTEPEGIETVAGRYTYLMPNPASETVTVASSFRIGEVELYDLNGKLLLRQKVDGLQTALDISSLTSGTYIVRITTNNGTAYKKLVVR